jgi:hypothetical protein
VEHRILNWLGLQRTEEGEGGGRGKNLKREFAISKIPMSSEIRHRHLALNGMDKVFDLFAKRDELEQPKEYQLPERCP